MRNLNVVAIECMRELDVANIPYRTVRKWEVNTRAKSRWGQCKQVSRGIFDININIDLLREENDIDGLKNTIIHELLHTCEGCMNHGDKWKMYADKVNRYYGYNISRCSNADEKGVTVKRENTRKVIHRFKCAGCGQVIERQRESKFTKYYHNYKCGVCGCKFEKIF